MEFVKFVSETAIAFIIVLTPIIVAIVSVAKSSGLNSRYAPLLSLVVGLSLGLLYGGFVNEYFNGLAGLLAGLVASGTYSAVKKTVKG